MSKKLLFTNAYFYRFDEKQWEMQKPYPPYGTILAAAIMREMGFKIDLFDCNLVIKPEEILPKLREAQPDYLVIFDDNFNYLSKMCLTVMRDACFELIKLGKGMGCKVLVNSADATDHYEKYLEMGADIVLLGEAEQTLQELLEYDLENLESIKGIAFSEAQKVVKTAKRQIFQELDNYPIPAWDLIQFADYQQIWQKSQGYFSLNIATTRGCPYKCNWCAKPIYGNRYNSRSPQKVAEELTFLMQKGATHFWVCDDIFGLKPNWVKDFKMCLKEKEIKPRLKIQSRADLLLKENTIDDLVACGLEEVWIGAESGSQRILDAMDKGITVEEIEKSTNLLKSKGVKVAFFLQYGYLSETWEDIEQTLSMVKNLLPDDLGISVSYPLPGTGFYEKVKNELANKQNWQDSNDLAMMYKATFSPEFYRTLHTHTHRVYRKEKALRDKHYKLPYLWLRERMSFKKLKDLI
jgi:anaerobic magnesium-protoporphyrin IX monomethyl ester cyclase